MREDCQVLEELGIATAIIRNDQVAYVTPGIDFRSLADRVLWKAHGQQTVMTWDGDGFFFRYTSPHSGTTVIAAGNTPFIAKSGIREGMAKSVIQTLLLFIVGTASASSLPVAHRVPRPVPSDTDAFGGTADGGSRNRKRQPRL